MREVGSHHELMAKPNGRYRRLQAMQDLGTKEHDVESAASLLNVTGRPYDGLGESLEPAEKIVARGVALADEVVVERSARNARRARLLAADDGYHFLVGGVGAIFAGQMFPSWGFVFAFMIEVLYTQVEVCPPVPDGSFQDCDAYYVFVAGEFRVNARKTPRTCCFSV